MGLRSGTEAKMRISIFGAMILAACWLNSASAQAPPPSSPPPQAAPTASATPTIQDFVLPAALSSVQISPNGQFIAAVRMASNGSEEIVVADWRSNHVEVIRTAPPNMRALYPWVRWKTDNRLIFG